MSFLKNRKGVIAAVVLLVVAAGAFAAGRLFWREDARDFYFKAESSNFKQYSQWLSQNYTAFRDKQEPYKTTPYKRRLEVTADVTSGGKPFGLENAGRIYDLIKRSKLVIDTERQPADDTAVSNITLLLERVPFMDTTAFTKDGKLYFTIPVLLPDRYFSADLQHLDAVYDRFSIPVRPKRLVNAADMARSLQFDGPAFEDSAAGLGRVFSGLIGEDAVKYGETAELTIAGQKVKGRTVQVTLSAASATELIGGLFKTAASDDALLAYTYGNFAGVMTLLEDAGLFRLSDYLDQTGTVVLNGQEKRLVETLSGQKNAGSFKNMLQTAMDGYSIKSDVVMSVVIDPEHRILDRKLTLDLAGRDDSGGIKADIHTGFSNTVFEDVRNRFAKVTLEQYGADGETADDAAADGNTADGNTAGGGTDKASGGPAAAAPRGTITEFSWVPAFDKASGTDTKGEIALHYAVHPRDGVPSGTDVHLDLSGTTDAKTLKRKDIIGFQADIGGGDGDGSIRGEWSKISWTNKKLNTKSYTAKLSVDAELPSFGISGLSAVIDLAGEDRMGIGPVSLPEVPQDKLTDLNTVSDAELDRIKMQAAASFGTFYLSNKSVFDALLGK
jgi:hypothetical protein